MMQLLIQGLRRDYENIDKVLDAAYDTDDASLTTDDVERAYHALDRLIEHLVLSQESYRGLTKATDIVRNCALDVQYIVGALSEPEMKEREEWHWRRLEALNNE